MIVVADLYGLGGRATSPGMATLADQIWALGPQFRVVGPVDQSNWQKAATLLDDAAKYGGIVAAVGYSLGANNIVQIAAYLAAHGRKVAYLAGVQASVWGAGCSPISPVIALPGNVADAFSIYNPSFIATVGLGYARYGAPARPATTSDLHPDVDNDNGVHGLILHDLKQLAA